MRYSVSCDISIMWYHVISCDIKRRQVKDVNSHPAMTRHRNHKIQVQLSVVWTFYNVRSMDRRTFVLLGGTATCFVEGGRSR